MARRKRRSSLSGLQSVHHKRCKGVVKSGPRKGKLKKGYRWKKGRGCPVKAG